MQRPVLVAIILVGILFSGFAWAGSDCVAPPGEWQSRDLLRQQVEQQGWTVQRIKVDDGCYEVRGTDRFGNKFKGKYAPDTLRIRKLEIKFGDGGDASDYLDQNGRGK